MRKYLEWTPVGSCYALSDWIKCLREPIGWVGALIGVTLWLVSRLYWGLGENPVAGLFAAAFGGTIWWIWVSFGRANGHGWSIVLWAAGMTIFMGVGATYDRSGDDKVFTTLIGLFGGALVGAIVPTSWRRLKGTVSSLSRARRARIALALPQIRLDDDDYFRSIVAGCEPFQARNYLCDGWGVNSAEELRSMVEWLCENGHAREVVATSERPRKVSPQMAEFLETNREELHSLGISAWDLGRAAQLVRWGTVAGYLNLSEGWELLSAVESSAKSLFSSWKEYGRSYVLGAEYWYAREGTAEGNIFAEAAEAALAERRGPWQKLPW